MKKLLMTIPVVCLMLVSCGGDDEGADSKDEKAGCDYATAKGVAECFCEIQSAKDAAKESGDDAAKKDLKAEMEKLEQEAEKHMEAGDYTENEIEEYIDEMCD